MYDSAKHVRIRRSQSAVEKAQHDPSMGNLMRVDQPTSLTLTEKPANERPFQILRNDGSMAPAPAAKRHTRIRRSDSPVLALTFPAGYTEEEVQGVLVEFHMTEYVVTADGNGIFTALRSDLQSLANIQRTDIKLNDKGVVATLDAASYSIQRAASTDNIAMVALEFDAKRFDADAISSWVTQNGVDSVQDTVENSSGDSITVKRGEYDEQTDVRRVQVEEGVVAVIKRSDVLDVPGGFAEAVCETAYGNWGWGHLDFAASMADVEFCRLMDDASYRIAEVLRRITIHSQLPLESRKALVDRSLAQYGEFVKNVIDALPRQVMLLVTRAAEKKESNTMSTVEQGTTTAAAPATPAVTDNTPITRADIDALVKAGIEAALAQRNEGTGTTAPAPAAAPAATTTEAARSDAPVTAPAAPAATDTINVSRADLAAMIAEANAPVLAQMAEMQNTVILRSDGGDRIVQAKAEGKEVKRSAAQVFTGSLPGLPIPGNK